MRKMIKVIACLLAMLMLSSCSASEPDSTAQVQNEQQDEMLIGISFDSFLIERWQTDRDVFVEAARE